MYLQAQETLTASVKIQYLRTLLRGEALRQLNTLCAQVGSTSKTHLNRIILGLGMYFTPINELSKQKRTILRRMRNPHELKLIRYADSIIDINGYLAALLGAKANDNIGKTELNERILISITNRCSK